MQISKLVKNLKTEFLNTLSLDLRALAIFRIGIGIMLLLDIFNIFRDLIPFYTNDGVLPINDHNCVDLACKDLFSLTNLEGTFSFHAMNGSLYFQIFLLLIAAFFAVNLIVGYKTRWMTVLSWILLVSVQNRNPAVLQGGDVIFRMMLFFSIFLPIGAKFSIDSLKERFQNGVSRFERINRIASIATLAFILQISILYIFAGLLKDNPEWNKNFTAAYYVLNLEIFTTKLGEFISQSFELMRVFTFSAYFLELLAGYILLIPIKNWIFRSFGVISLIGFHLGLAATMHLGLFSYILVVGLLALLPTEFIDLIEKIVRKYFNPKKREIYFNPEIRSEFLRVNAIKTFGMTFNLEFIERRAKESSKIGLRDFKNNSLFLFWLPKSFKVPKLIEGKFNNLSKNQVLQSTQDTKNTRDPLWKFLILNLIPTISIMIIFFWNLGHLHQKSYLNQTFTDIAIFFRFDQNWNMFAPAAYKDDGWFVVWGTYSDGTQKALLGDKKPEKYTRPDDLSGEFTSQRWRKYMLNLYDPNYSDYRNLYLEYLCRRENKGTKTTLQRIELEFVLERVTLPYIPKTQNIVKLGEHICY